MSDLPVPPTPPETPPTPVPAPSAPLATPKGKNVLCIVMAGALVLLGIYLILKGSENAVPPKP